jgi:hypothetical protein
MNDFSKWYLALLRKQVDEEIQFLVTNGHDSDQIRVPCMFCTQRPQGHYVCYRLNELRRFQSSILQHEFNSNRQQERNIPKARRAIGFDERPIHQGNKQTINLNPEVDFSKMPLLSTKI